MLKSQNKKHFQSKMLLTLFLVLPCVPLAAYKTDDLSLFHKFINDFTKPYKNDTKEFYTRFEIFKDNLKYIQEMNKPYASSVYGITKFSDLTQKEFKEKYLSGFRKQSRTSKPLLLHSLPSSAQLKIQDVPSKIDWRSYDVVTPVKNQKQCGACWAFSVTETIESSYAIKYNTSAPQLAVQQLIDCDTYNNFGCSGGDTCRALYWVQKNGITFEKNYPLTDQNGNCKPLSPTDKLVKVSNYTCEDFVGEENSLVSRLGTTGPVAAAVDASTWNNYVGGIIQFHCANNTNHAVEIVGYDRTGPVPYYIVRNSWGPDFGLDGYIYIKIGSNLCGIAEQISSVTVV